MRNRFAFNTLCTWRCWLLYFVTHVWRIFKIFCIFCLSAFVHHFPRSGSSGDMAYYGAGSWLGDWTKIFLHFVLQFAFSVCVFACLCNFSFMSFCAFVYFQYTCEVFWRIASEGVVASVGWLRGACTKPLLHCVWQLALSVCVFVY